jgi:hypothetical protein
MPRSTCFAACCQYSSKDERDFRNSKFFANYEWFIGYWSMLTKEKKHLQKNSNTELTLLKNIGPSAITPRWHLRLSRLLWARFRWRGMTLRTWRYWFVGVVSVQAVYITHAVTSVTIVGGICGQWSLTNGTTTPTTWTAPARAEHTTTSTFGIAAWIIGEIWARSSIC